MNEPSRPARRKAATTSTDRLAEPAAPLAPTAELSPQEQLLLRRFRVVFNAVKTHFRQVEKHAGLGGAQLWALGVIHDRPGLGMNDLASAMDVHQSTASNLVRTLVERQLVFATRGAADRRAVVLKILPHGKKVLAKAPGPFTGVLPAALKELDSTTVKRLNADLGKLIAVLETDESAGSTPLAEL